jgi:signal transduction histidine kinase
LYILDFIIIAPLRALSYPYFNKQTVPKFSTITLISIGLFLSHFADAQNREDSLLLKLNETTEESSKIKILIALVSEYQYIDIERSLDFAEQAIAIAEQKDIPTTDKGKAYASFSSLKSVQGDLASAIKYNNLALNTYYQLKDSAGIAKCYNNLGTNYSSLGKFDESYYYFTQSYRLAITSNKQKLQRAISLHNIGGVFKELGQYERAVDYYKLSLKISKEIGDKEGEPYYYSEMGDVYIRKKQYDSALQSLTYSLKLARQMKLTINDLEPSVMLNIAKTYLLLNQATSSLSYYDSAFNSFEKNKNQYGLAQVDLGKGMVLMKEKKFAEAQQLIEKSAVTAHQLNAWTLEMECYENLSKLLEEKADFRKSLDYFRRYEQLKDSLFSQGMQAKLLQDQIQFETASKEDQINQLTKLEQLRIGEIKKQEILNNILVVAVALTGILLFAVYRSGQRRIKINKLLLEHQEEIKKRSIELEQLNKVKDKFFSIISHDLRSPINALTGILDLMDKNQISPDEFIKLNKELRIQFNHTKTLINNLLDWTLLQMDKLKIQLEKIDLSRLVDENIKMLTSLHLKEIKVNNLIAPTTFALGDTNMINLVLRNLLTNAIKFSEAGQLIEIACKKEGADHIISVKDNGVGINPDIQHLLFEKTTGYSTRGTANEKGTGLGLILCKEFVERNGGKIWLESEIGKGSTFYFTVKVYA